MVKTVKHVTLKVKDVAFEFALIPPGKLPDGTEIQDSFWIMTTPVTNEMYEAVIGEVPSKNKSRTHPTTNVNFFDVQEFCKKLGDLLQIEGVCLPTSEQWEYACRAGTTTHYNVGDKISEADANFNNNVGSTTEVKSYPSNDWGLYDMHGNVWEWTSSEWKE